MQRKNSEDNDEVFSETCGTDDLLDANLVTDLAGVQSSTSSAAPLLLGAEPDADECTTVVGGSNTAATTEEIHLSLNPGSSRRSSVADGDFCRSTQSPSSRTSSPLRPVKRDNYSECFSDTSLEAGHMENEKENLNVSRLNKERQRTMLEKEMSSNLTSTEMPSKLSHLASGDDSTEDGDQSCHGISCMPGYLKDLCESSSRPPVPRVMDAPAPVFSSVFLPENPPNSSRQSSVKQLESFVASVECHSPSKPKPSEKKGPSIVQMPVAALSRKCKSSRLKTHSLNLPKMLKQPPESVCQYSLPPQASDPNQPLDLSVKTRQKDVQPGETKYLSCLSDSTISAVGTAGSSLADLEKKFGNTSAIFDRIGTKTWASPFCGALVSRLGVNLYNSKLHGAFSDSVSAFGIGMIPVPVQRFNTSLNSVQTVQAAKPDVPLLTKTEQTEPATTDSEAVCHAAEPSFHWHQKQTADASSDQRKHTNFQCSCGAELETLYHLTMHLQQTGHAPNKLKNVGRQEYSKLVRGQDMWLNHGCEQTRQILRCMECDESFKSLPELTVHMIQTKHYANIVGADTLQRKVPSKNSESRSEPSSESSDANRVHCLVCLEPFDDAESLGNHILEAGHYKSTSERVEDRMIPKKETDYQSHSSKPKSGPDSLVDPASPQSGIEDSSSLEAMPIKIERDRKRDHSSEGCILDDCKKYDTTKRSRTMRSSTSENDVSKGRQEKDLVERTQESPGRFVEPTFEVLRRSSSAGLKEKLENNQGSPGENDSLPGSCDDNSYKPNCSQRSTRSDSEKSCRATEETMEMSNSSAFHMENFFRPPSNSSSDGSAIRAMETFIKNSFGSTDTKNRSKVMHQMSHLDSTSLVSSLISRFGTYVEHQKPSQNVTGRQEIRSSETPENSSLYQNKYLPPVYIAPLSDGQTESDRVLTDGQYWPGNRRVKSESTEAMQQKGLERQSLDSEGPSRESESAGRELERPASVEKQSKPKWVQQRPDNDIPQDHFRRSEADSVIHDNFLFGIKSNKSTDLKAAERTKGGIDIGDTENDERPSSTSNNLSRSSALESLQGLVYGKALNSEHPLDSLQKLIYGRAGAGVVNSSVSGSGVGHVLHGPNGSHAAVIMKGSDALHHPLPPGTLILVNPIVTVVPGASGSNPSLNITLPGCEPSPGAPVAGDDGTKRTEAGRRLQSPLDDRENSLRIYRCRGCRRKFSSKGSYRYHLSRCHVLTSSTSSEKCSSVKEPLKKSPYICLPLDATAKFNKYYKLASELGTEAK